jgi:pimeloyl-ACP methyl ester carboxylesterase
VGMDPDQGTIQPFRCRTGKFAMQFVHAGGHRLEYRWIDPESRASSTPGESPVLVFLHEGLGSVALWKGFPDAVVQATGSPALVYSRYGYGKSDPLTGPREVDYMHREALEILPELLDVLSIRNPLLIGHSDGASIALIRAGAARSSVRGVVAMSPHVFVEDVSIASIAQAKAAFETTDLPDRLGRYHDDVASAFRGWNDIWLHPDFQRWNIESYLPAITCPVLLIQGEDDQYGTMAQVEAIQRQAGGPVETVKLAHCGHSPHVDQPEATLHAIEGFVRRAGSLR